MHKCEGLRGGNQCGRQAEFIITDLIHDDKTVYFSCERCPGRIMDENDLDHVDVERIYD